LERYSSNFMETEDSLREIFAESYGTGRSIWKIFPESSEVGRFNRKDSQNLVEQESSLGKIWLELGAVCEEGAEESIWTKEGWSDGRVQKTAQRISAWFVHFKSTIRSIKSWRMRLAGHVARMGRRRTRVGYS
jgi:hypothetical protein